MNKFTDFGYTNQRDYSYIGLMDYDARWYSPTLGCFTQPDSIVPDAGNPQAWNRYSYVLNSPLMYIDPSGHMTEKPCADDGLWCGDNGAADDPPTTNYSPDMPKPPTLTKCDRNPEACEGSGEGNNNEKLSMPSPEFPHDLCITNGSCQWGTPFQFIAYDISRVDPWEIGLDVFGLVADYVPILQAIATPLEFADSVVDNIRGINKLLEYGQGVKAFIDINTIPHSEDFDYVNTLLDLNSIIPGEGASTSLFGIFYNLSKGFYIKPYEYND